MDSCFDSCSYGSTFCRKAQVIFAPARAYRLPDPRKWRRRTWDAWNSGFTGSKWRADGWPIAAAYDQTVVSREITLAAETWYAIQTGVFSNEDAAREKAELLTDRGAPGAVVEDGEKWRVFIACYGTETDAASVRQRLGENQRIETYLYRWTCPELQLRLKGMAGQVDVAEAGFTLLLQAARTLRDTASLLDAGELTLTEAQEQITALDGQLTLWRQTAQERFGRNPPSPIKELLALSDAWAQIRGNLENQDSKTALSAQLKLEGIGLFGRMIALRQGMGA